MGHATQSPNKVPNTLPQTGSGFIDLSLEVAPPPSCRELARQSTFVPMEAEWCQLELPDNVTMPPARTFASRWTDAKRYTREATTQIGSDHHLIILVLQRTSLGLELADRRIHDGSVMLGMTQVSRPGTFMRCTFRAPCDFLHLRITNRSLAEFHEEVYQRPWSGELPMTNSGFSRDAVIEQLIRALLAAQTATGDLNVFCADGIATAIAARLLTVGKGLVGTAPGARVSALAKWRLRRAVDFIEAHLAGPILLSDIATAAGLTRMHFAAQFRAATGFRPHEYLLRRRIDRAQALLADTDRSLVDVALEVGFQSQAHFSTVFRRYSGESPLRWRQANDACPPLDQYSVRFTNRTGDSERLGHTQGDNALTR